MVSKVMAAAAAMLGLAGAAEAAQSSPRLDWASVPLPAIDGGQIAPDSLKGKVVLLVNTASNCGFTPQYQGLQEVWKGYRDRGLVVLGVPSNDFGGQEPGTNKEVQAFCQVNYGVDFPLMAKQPVTGEQAHPLFRWAASQAGFAGSPKWNFHKYLIGRDGRLIDWYSSMTAPTSDKVRAAIEKALAEPAG